MNMDCHECPLNPIPIGSMVLLYLVTFTINIPQMLAYIIPYMDPMGDRSYSCWLNPINVHVTAKTLRAKLQPKALLESMAKRIFSATTSCHHPCF